MTSIDRVLDDLPPDYPEALMKLIDALRDFIRSEEELGRDLLREEQITRETYDAAQKRMEPYRIMLKDLEDREFDPTLNGYIRSRRR